MFRRRIFKRPDRNHLWDTTSSSSSSNDEAEINNQANIEVIDLTREPGRRIQPASVNNMVIPIQSNVFPSLQPPATAATTLQSSPIQRQEQQKLAIPSYIPRTLQQPDQSRRYSILPAFPTSFYNNQPFLLLANVPKAKLNQDELARRQQGVYALAYAINEQNFYIPSYFRDNYQLFISSLIFQYNIDEAILDYNLYRFSQCYRTFADDYIQRHKYPAEQFELNDTQKKYAFEFYLQIDVDLFFMKTCSFRGAKPRSIDEGLFCIDEPDIRYGLSPCNNCSLCVPSNDVVTRRQQPIIRFGPSQKVRFINGYQTILNCPANCQTRNIIYVMTCPCGDFEYIGETSQRLADRLWYHRQHWNRIIHEFLIGEQNVQLPPLQVKDGETLRKDRMLLYKHAARCPWTIQIFLKFNPIYSCLIPITTSAAAHESRRYILPSTLIRFDSIHPTSIATKNRRDIAATPNTRSDEETRSCMRNIPPVPSNYTFSIRQRVEQFQYFKNKQDINMKQNQFVDLFNVALIAVLPVDATDPVRRFVEALFITHTESKLNKSGRLTQQNDDTDQDINTDRTSVEFQLLDRGEWCRNIVF